MKPSEAVSRTIGDVQKQIAILELSIAKRKLIVNGLCRVSGQYPIYQTWDIWESVEAALYPEERYENGAGI